MTPDPKPVPELLPCPFCGSGDIHKSFVSNTGRNVLYFYCPKCSAHGPWSNAETLRAKWNCRITPAPDMSEQSIERQIDEFIGQEIDALKAESADLRRRLEASNKALAFIKDRITSSDDFDSDEIVKVIEDCIGRYSQSIEWFASKMLQEDLADWQRVAGELAGALDAITNHSRAVLCDGLRPQAQSALAAYRTAAMQPKPTPPSSSCKSGS